MLELKTGPADGEELNFNIKVNLSYSLIQRKKYMQRVTLKEHSQFDCKYQTLDTASLNC